jgi:hypothetical protein
MASVFAGKPPAGAPKKARTAQQQLEDAEAAEKKAIEEAAAQVPFSRLLAMNRPEWGYGILGSVASAAVGGVQVSPQAHAACTQAMTPQTRARLSVYQVLCLMFPASAIRLVLLPSLSAVASPHVCVCLSWGSVVLSAMYVHMSDAMTKH